MPSPLPLVVHFQEHDAVRVSSLIISALELGHVDLVDASVSSEDGSRL